MTACVLVAGLGVALLAAGQPATAQTISRAPAAAYELVGHVMDGAGRPLGAVEVALERDSVVVHTVLTSDDGRFTFGTVAAGPITLRIRRLGYAQRNMDLVVGEGLQPASVEVVLTTVPTQLEEIFIRADSSASLGGFHTRKRQRDTFARFLEERDIRRIGPTNSSDLFRSVPGIAIRAASAGGNTIRIRGCQPMVWVDGQRVPGAELDEVAQPEEIVAIEFYPSFAGVPAQYLERGNRLCGLILVWTK